MKNLSRLWILTGLAFLLVGMGLGLKMSMTQNFALHGLHAHLNLLGFVLMTLFGLCYRNWPKLQEGVLGTVHYFLHTATVAVALTLLYLILSNTDLAAKIGPMLDIVLLGTYAGTILFAYLFFTRTKE
jgi:hypothetical protein